jgi:SsrA-binding protein
MKVINRKAHYNYQILQKFEAGIVLTGPEVKSVKEGKIKLDDAFVKIINNELWLINAHIHPYMFSDNRNYNPTATRKLLIHKKELISLQNKIDGRNLALVPISCYNKGSRIKLEVGIGKGKKQWEKREKIKQRDIQREIERTLKNNKSNF